MNETKLIILLVDDDIQYLNCVKQFLLSRGWDVHVAYSSEDAKATLTERVFDLLITDFDMPGTNGIELAIEVRKMRPEMPIILQTGNPTSELYSLADKAVVSKVLSKLDGLNVLKETIWLCCRTEDKMVKALVRS